MSSYRQILYHIVFRTKNGGKTLPQEQEKNCMHGYAALTQAWRDKEMIINYIKNQQEHHKTENFLEEYRRILEENGIVIDDKYFP